MEKSKEYSDLIKYLRHNRRKQVERYGLEGFPEEEFEHFLTAFTETRFEDIKKRDLAILFVLHDVALLTQDMMKIRGMAEAVKKCAEEAIRETPEDKVVERWIRRGVGATGTMAES